MGAAAAAAGELTAAEAAAADAVEPAESAGTPAVDDEEAEEVNAVAAVVDERVGESRFGWGGMRSAGTTGNLKLGRGRSTHECVGIRVRGTQGNKTDSSRGQSTEQLFSLSHWNPTPVSHDIRIRKGDKAKNRRFKPSSKLSINVVNSS